MKKGYLEGGRESTVNSRKSSGGSKLTICVVSETATGEFCLARSGHFNRGGVDQQNRDVVLNRIDAAAFATLQAFGFVLQRERLLANRANQNIEQILANHTALILQPARAGSIAADCDKIAEQPIKDRVTREV
jgi:hypothetical protein